MEDPTQDNISSYVGIDEAGRGPLAGPVAVGVVRASNRNMTLPYFSEVKVSKKLARQKREEIYEKMKLEALQGNISYAVSFVGSKVIDRIGINAAIRLAIKRSLNRLVYSAPKTYVLLDGGLRAPARFGVQETIIKGDEKESLIALASIVAKVERDRKMVRFSEKYPEYSFEEHKGYGTQLHTRMIQKCGPCALHRKTFIRNIEQQN